MGYLADFSRLKQTKHVHLNMPPFPTCKSKRIDYGKSLAVQNQFPL
jgi:hypothetical protein